MSSAKRPAPCEEPLLVRKGAYGRVDLRPTVSIAVLEAAQATLAQINAGADPLGDALKRLKAIDDQMAPLWTTADPDRPAAAGPGSAPHETAGGLLMGLAELLGTADPERRAESRAAAEQERQARARYHAVRGYRCAITTLTDCLSRVFSARDRAAIAQAIAALLKAPRGLGSTRHAHWGPPEPDADGTPVVLLPAVSSWKATPATPFLWSTTTNAWRWPTAIATWEPVWTDVATALDGTRRAKVEAFLEAAAAVHALQGATPDEVHQRAQSLRAVPHPIPADANHVWAVPLTAMSTRFHHAGGPFDSSWLATSARFLTRLKAGEFAVHDDPSDAAPDPLGESSCYAVYFATGYLAANKTITPTLGAARLFASPQAAKRGIPSTSNLPTGPDQSVTPVIVEVRAQVVRLAPQSPRPGADQEGVARVLAAIDRAALEHVVEPACAPAPASAAGEPPAQRRRM